MYSANDVTMADCGGLVLDVVSVLPQHSDTATHTLAPRIDIFHTLIYVQDIKGNAQIIANFTLYTCV